MRSRQALAAAVLGALSLTAALPLAAQMRCGNALVREGDRKVEVLLKCGEPLAAEKRHRCFYALGCETVEEWIYDVGSQKMLRVLTFRGGRLQRIEQVPRP